MICLYPLRGTGMIASSSTFRPHPGRVIRDLFRLLDAVTALYGSTSLQQSSKGSCSLLVSGYNLWGGLPVAYPGSYAQQRSQCSTRISASADVGRGSLK